MNIFVHRQQVSIYMACMYLHFVPGNFGVLTNDLSILCRWLTSSKLVKFLKSLNACLFNQASSQVVFLQALIQASQSSAGCWLQTPHELCECQCSTIRL
jgi:hypothetical protein